MCSTGFCSNITMARVYCFIGFIAVTVCEPMAILPYFARTIRIYTIFRAQQYYFENKRKPDRWFKWIKEPRLFQVSSIPVAILFSISLICYIIFLNSSSPDLLKYVPSYSISVCF